jgi:hypothetical protein
MLAAIVVMGACGGDEEKDGKIDPNSMEEVARRMKAHKEKTGGGKKKDKALGDTEVVRVKLSKPGWVLLAKSFSEYMEEGYTPNIFQPHANEMIARPRIHYRPDGADGTDQGTLGKTDTEGEKKKDPLQEYNISEYKLILTMLGTSQPKALVTDPKGRGHVLTVNPPTWVGRKRYQVKAIGRYNVELEIQGENANLNSIKPPYIGKGRPPVAKISAAAFIGISGTPPRSNNTKPPATK